MGVGAGTGTGAVGVVAGGRGGDGDGGRGDGGLEWRHSTAWVCSSGSRKLSMTGSASGSASHMTQGTQHSTWLAAHGTSRRLKGQSGHPS